MNWQLPSDDETDYDIDIYFSRSDTYLEFYDGGLYQCVLLQKSNVAGLIKILQEIQGMIDDNPRRKD